MSSPRKASTLGLLLTPLPWLHVERAIHMAGSFQPTRLTRPDRPNRAFSDGLVLAHQKRTKATKRSRVADEFHGRPLPVELSDAARRKNSNRRNRRNRRGARTSAADRASRSVLDGTERSAAPSIAVRRAMVFGVFHSESEFDRRAGRKESSIDPRRRLAGWNGARATDRESIAGSRGACRPSFPSLPSVPSLKRRVETLDDRTETRSMSCASSPTLTRPSTESPPRRTPPSKPTARR